MGLIDFGVFRQIKLIHLRKPHMHSFVLAAIFAAVIPSTEDTMSQTVNSFTAKSITGQEVALNEYTGKVLLIVNTASECGYTPHYEGLEALYKRFASKGFSVLGFPCNQFGEQEPGTDAEILKFCQGNYHVTFPLFAKIEVNGENAHPLYKYLTKAAPAAPGEEEIKWNFTKFLVDREGKVIKRYHHRTDPADIAADIELALHQPISQTK